MKLIIAEKPSLGRSIMGSLGEKFQKHDEYYRSENYCVVPLHGHILELKAFEEYPQNEGKSMWAVKNLPFFPEQYEYNISRGNKKIYDCIRKLLMDPQVTEVIHCGDADREGQIIVDLVLEKIGNTKPVSRPFIKSTTKEGLRQAFAERRPNEEYRTINAEGKTRAFVDFDFGINLSRYASKRAGARTGLNVGRVIGAIVTEIYNRDMEIENFVPRDYFKVESDLEVKLTSKKEFDAKPSESPDAQDGETQARRYAEELNRADAVVADVKKAKQTKRAPRLFSQTDLQGAANKRFGFSPKRTLKAAQSLYEKGLITYPRTNTNFMAEGDRPMIAGVLKRLGAEFEMKPVFDDSKVDGHSAITPTGSYKEVTGDEQKIYMMILNRFRAVFCKEPCTVLKTTLTIDCIDPSTGKSIEQFKVSGEVPLTQGWKKFEPVSEQTTMLPDLNVGDHVEHDFQPVAAQTKPPAHYTVTTLGKWMQNPFRKSEEDEVDYARMLSGMEIGTEATRAAIIDKAIRKDYIKLTKNTYTIQPNGRFLVETCRALGIDMSSVKTAEMGRDTKAVARGEKTTEEVLAQVRREITQIITGGTGFACSPSGTAYAAGQGGAADAASPEQTGSTGTGARSGAPVGSPQGGSQGEPPAAVGFEPKESELVCPKCGKHLMETLNKLECDCGFLLWKTVARKRLDDETIRTLLQGKKTPVLSGFTGKKGTFSAILVPSPEGKVTFEFPPREPVGSCPKCGKPVFENSKGFGCSGYQDGCDFVIWKYDRYTKTKIGSAQARKLLAGETISTSAKTIRLEEGALRIEQK